MKKPNSANMKKFFLLMACTVLGLGSCTERPQPLEIDNALTAEEIAAGRFTPEVMWKMGRLGGSQLSPDGKRLVYTVTYYNLGENRGVTALYLRDMASGEVRQLTDHTSNRHGRPTGARSISCRTAAARSRYGTWPPRAASRSR